MLGVYFLWVTPAANAAKDRVESELIYYTKTAACNANKLISETTKISKFGSISYAATALTLVITLTIFLTQPAMMTAPQWLIELNHIANIPYLDQFWSALNTPTYITTGIMLITGFSLKVLSVNWFRLTPVQKKGLNQ